MIKRINDIYNKYTILELCLKIVNFLLFKIKGMILWLLNIILSFIDKLIKKEDSYWIFPTYFIGKAHLSDNMLAVFEIVKDDKKIKKIILTKDISVEVNGSNIVIIPMHSLFAIYYLMRSNIVFVQHSIWLDMSKAIFQIKNPLKRKIINLWHGIPMKDISHKNTGIINKRAIKEMLNYYVIASSDIDLNNMKKAFYLTPKENFWLTGLPRNDFLSMDKEKLPYIYKRELELLSSKVDGKTLYLYAPTYKEKNMGGEHYHFTEDELNILENFLVNNDIILALRYHSYLEPSDYSYILKRSNIIDCSSSIISDVRMLIREAKVVITDYSSLFIDALYIDKKCISFAYDLEHYKDTQRGFFYDFEEVFPGDICQTFDTLMNSLENSLMMEDMAKEKYKYKRIKNIFFKYNDTKNAYRVVNEVKKIINVNT